MRDQFDVARGTNPKALPDARIAVHFPRAAADLEPARARLAYEELFLHQAALRLRRGERRSTRDASSLGRPGKLVGEWVDSLPFAFSVRSQ